MRRTIHLLLFFAAGLLSAAQKVKFSPVEKPVVVQRARQSPASDSARAVAIREMFVDAGCEGNFLVEQRPSGHDVPNVICRLKGETDQTIVIGAHVDRVSSAQRPLDDWSGSALLPSLYQCLREKKRHHTLIFVAFADQANTTVGADYFVNQMKPSEITHVSAMINLDTLGLSPTKIWAAHSDKELVKALVAMVYTMKLPASQVDLGTIGNSDSSPFAAHQVPQITVHSLTQENVATGATTAFRPNNYYDTYRLLCAYLAYLDQTLRPRTHAE